MHVVFAVPGSLDDVSGGYAYDRRIIAALRDQGHSVEVASLAGRHPLPDDAALEAAGALLAGTDRDARLVIDGLGLPSFAPHAADLVTRRAVALIHHPTALETGAPPDEREALRAIERGLLPRLARIVTSSDATAKRLAEEFAADPARIASVPPGVDPAPRSHGSGRITCCLLSVGNLTARKGHDVLLKALGRLKDLDWQLTIAGAEREVGQLAYLRRTAEKAGISRRVAFPGAVVEAELEALWDTSDVFALATRYEGYGMAIAEALRHGLPVVTTDGAPAASLVSAEAGTVVAADDADMLSRCLRRVIADVPLRRAMACAAWKIGQTLGGWHQQAEAFAAAIA
ncbi:MAG: glycosyltransferase family 4 protein [Rhodospirillales bacterium]|nr:glycosyltransferase family 4 protein [Rhodospirillales bacterium]